MADGLPLDVPGRAPALRSDPTPTLWRSPAEDAGLEGAVLGTPLPPPLTMPAPPPGVPYPEARPAPPLKRADREAARVGTAEAGVGLRVGDATNGCQLAPSAPAPVNAAAVSGVLPTAGCPYGLTPALGSARGVSTCTLARRGRALEDHTSPPAPAPPPVPPPPYATGEVITVEPMVEAWAVDAASSQEGARGVLGGGPTGESRVEGRVWDAGGVSVTMGCAGGAVV